MVRDNLCGIAHSSLTSNAIDVCLIYFLLKKQDREVLFFVSLVGQPVLLGNQLYLSVLQRLADPK
jgi:hypothetical protein